MINYFEIKFYNIDDIHKHLLSMLSFFINLGFHSFGKSFFLFELLRSIPCYKIFGMYWVAFMISKFWRKIVPNIYPFSTNFNVLLCLNNLQQNCYIQIFHSLKTNSNKQNGLRNSGGMDQRLEKLSRMKKWRSTWSLMEFGAYNSSWYRPELETTDLILRLDLVRVQWGELRHGEKMRLRWIKLSRYWPYFLLANRARWLGLRTYVFGSRDEDLFRAGLRDLCWILAINRRQPTTERGLRCFGSFSISFFLKHSQTHVVGFES